MARVYNAATFNPQTGEMSAEDMSAFRQAGGKLLIYHGWGDALVTPQPTVGFYEGIVKKSGGIGPPRSSLDCSWSPAWTTAESEQMAQGFQTPASTPSQRWSNGLKRGRPQIN